MTSNLLRYLLSVKSKRKNSCFQLVALGKFQEGCLGFKYPFSGFRSEFRQRNLFQYNGEATCGLSLLLVLSFAPRGFSLDTPVFPSPQKPRFSNSNSTRNQVDEEPLSGCGTSKVPEKLRDNFPRYHLDWALATLKAGSIPILWFYRQNKTTCTHKK